MSFLPALLALALVPLSAVPIMRRSLSFEMVLRADAFLAHVAPIYLFFWATGQTVTPGVVQVFRTGFSVAFFFAHTTSRIFQNYGFYDRVYTALTHVLTAGLMVFTAAISLDQFKMFLLLLCVLVPLVFLAQVFLVSGNGLQVRMVRAVLMDPSAEMVSDDNVAHLVATNLGVPLALLAHILLAPRSRAYPRGIFVDTPMLVAANLFTAMTLAIALAGYLRLSSDRLAMLRFVEEYQVSSEHAATLGERAAVRAAFLASTEHLAALDRVRRLMVSQATLSDGSLDVAKLLQHSGAGKDPATVYQPFVDALQASPADLLAYVAGSARTFITYSTAMVGFMPYDLWRPDPDGRTFWGTWGQAVTGMLGFFVLINGTAGLLELYLGA